MKVSIIVPTYKDIVALELILKALEKQTYKNFEVIIAEDDNDQGCKEFIKNFKTEMKILHVFHENNGNRKATILNKALLMIEGDYVIFIDGDCIPYTTFIESHVKLSTLQTVLCGRRVNLGDKVSKDLREGKTTSFELESSYLLNYRYISKDNFRHYEQGLRFSSTSWIYKLISRNDKNIHIVGSNFSCFRDDIFKINGFDEDIVGGSKDDVDLEWRFLQSGCKLKTCKFSANLFHLNHKRSSRVNDEYIAQKQMTENKLNRKFICTNGIKKL